MVDASATHLEGTAPYMSPAVARGEAEDTRCDIYAFGALLYELLAGNTPYTGRTPQIILDQVLKGPPPPLRDANPSLIRIVEGCMARELRDRYASMGDVVADLDRAAKGALPLGPHLRRPRLLRLAAATTILLVAVGLSVLWLANPFGRKILSQPRQTPALREDSNDGIRRFLDQLDHTRAQGLTATRAASPTATDARLFDYKMIARGCISILKYKGSEQTVSIPASINGLKVTRIESQAFNGNTNIIHLRIPNGVAVIYGPAFQGCTRLADIVIPEGVQSIGGSAFAGTALTRVAIPSSVTTLENKAFFGCTGLTMIVVNARNPVYSSSDDGVLFDSRKSLLIAYPAGKAGDYTVPDHVTRIETYAFNSARRLTGITLPASIKAIGDSAFGGCPALKRVSFLGGPPEMGVDVFKGSANATLDHLPGVPGWGETFAGRPTARWVSKAD